MSETNELVCAKEEEQTNELDFLFDEFKAKIIEYQVKSQEQQETEVWLSNLSVLELEDEWAQQRHQYEVEISDLKNECLLWMQKCLTERRSYERQLRKKNDMIRHLYEQNIHLLSKTPDSKEFMKSFSEPTTPVATVKK